MAVTSVRLNTTNDLKILPVGYGYPVFPLVLLKHGFMHDFHRKDLQVTEEDKKCGAQSVAGSSPSVSKTSLSPDTYAMIYHDSE